MRRFTLFIVSLIFGAFACTVAASAGSGTVLKKGNQTVVVYQSVSDRNSHWVERNGHRSKKSGSASGAVSKFLSRGYKRAGSQTW